MSQSTQSDQEDALLADIASFAHDPAGFVRFAFPWGEGQLAEEKGPREWQMAVLTDVKQHLESGKGTQEAIKLAVASGHGIGKSALVSWLILWAISTCPNTRGVVTANTEGQLRTKTWPEVRKWHNLAMNSHWFTCAATSLHAKGDAEKTWRVDAIPWSEHNTEAFAGLHNKGSRILLVFDEASAIADNIWEVAQGALSDENTEIMWFCFGNPTRNSGRFHDCFGLFKSRWISRQIDSRTVEGTNKIEARKLIEDYGEDHDIVRVRIKGMFPRTASMQFISSESVLTASTKEAACWPNDALILGVDVARYGGDETIIQPRKGRDARTWPRISIKGENTMDVAGRVSSECARYRMLGIPVSVVYVDETGVGAGVVDRLRQLGVNVLGVNNGSKPDQISIDGELVGNKAAEMWANMRSWLKDGGAIDPDVDLMRQLESREYGYNVHNAIVLERKDDMKRRGLSSPDRADALALTFAYPIVPLPRLADGQAYGIGTCDGDWDPYR